MLPPNPAAPAEVLFYPNFISQQKGKDVSQFSIA
jgi:hypothetical protein